MNSSRILPRCPAHLWVWAVGVMLLAGCVAIPVDYYSAGSRRNLNLETPSSLKPGETTKEEVFLMLGEPDFVSQDGRHIGYVWHKVKAIIAVGGYGAGAVGESEKSYLLQISFDDNNRVSRSDLVEKWGTDVPPPPAPRE